MQSDGIQLKCETPAAWIDVVLNDFNSFLIDHAACERKASATGLHFVAKYVEKPQLIDAMIRFAREELYHFHQVSKIILKRGLRYAPDTHDEYANGLLSKMRNGREHQLLDRLLVVGVIEARGHEKFGLVAKHIQDPELKIFYSKLTEAERGHQSLFLKMANLYYNNKEVEKRLQEYLEIEAGLIQSLPIRSAVH